MDIVYSNVSPPSEVCALDTITENELVTMLEPEEEGLLLVDVKSEGTESVRSHGGTTVVSVPTSPNDDAPKMCTQLEQSANGNNESKLCAN
jgi:hypothetical protein